ncbi:pyrroline-5-carboxylate reductase family protein [Neobacillus sp. PS3-34]|uniref:pyrroline-5-carboxylate reductase family protein n=1 Tax=Neobacillus sp. PS3-34 TaxID=3070678 RepID=UPI0035A6D66F
MKKLVVVGAGSMAEALISGITSNGLLEKQNIWVTNRSDRKKLDRLHLEYGVSITYDLEALFKDADVIVLAMKPKDALSGIKRISPFLTEKALIISVLAASLSIPLKRSLVNSSQQCGPCRTLLLQLENQLQVWQ